MLLCYAFVQTFQWSKAAWSVAGGTKNFGLRPWTQWMEQGDLFRWEVVQHRNMISDEDKKGTLYDLSLQSHRTSGQHQSLSRFQPLELRPVSWFSGASGSKGCFLFPP